MRAAVADSPQSLINTVAYPGIGTGLIGTIFIFASHMIEKSDMIENDVL